MRVLVIGASGFLGSALVAALQDAGHAATWRARDVARLRRLGPQAAAMTVDFSADVEAAQWSARLRGIDAVVNAAGILRQQHRNRFERLHDRGLRALYAARADAGVRRIVLISALGADTLFTATTMLLQPLSGAWPVHRSGLPWSTHWLAASLLLFGVAALVWLRVVVLQLQMRGLAREAVANGAALPPPFVRCFREWVALGFVALLCFLAIFYLMVVKPA
ncbi:DUF2269 family protein [Tahibacter caeni]|uniref:DUF2269 family protein n=1 Tax=Tahibacter caeni TaxID=1453545 RepID=UPI00214743CF|nr:DUF2269 family protein [Tahibacter caeni]